MPTPIIDSVYPTRGSTQGGDLIRIVGDAFSERVEVRFGNNRVGPIITFFQGGAQVVEVLSPAHGEGEVDLVLQNVDIDGQPLVGEATLYTSTYHYQRTSLVQESGLTRLVRTLMQQFKRDLVPKTMTPVSVDYGESSDDGSTYVALARLPALVLSGPAIEENRFYSTNVQNECPVTDTLGPRTEVRRSPLTFDLRFMLTAAARRSTELLNLVVAVLTFFGRAPWLEIASYPSEASDSKRLEMDLIDEFRTTLHGPGDIKSCKFNFIVRGFDIDLRQTVGSSRVVDMTELQSASLDPEVPDGRC